MIWGGKNIVIACSDAVEYVLDCNRDLLSSKYIIPGASKQGRIAQLMNKERMSILATECGLNIPPSVSVDIDNISDHLASKLEYPIIIKPIISAGNTKSDIMIFDDKKSFLNQVPNISATRIQIQKFINKETEFQLIGCSLNEGETIIIPGASIILRQPKNTNTGFLKYVPADAFSYDKDAVERFIRATGYSGLFSMEFLRAKDGKDYFMEINFRNDGNAICVTAAGVNLPYIWVMNGRGINIDDYINDTKAHEVIVMPEFSDLKNVIMRKITIWRWIRDIYRTDAFMDFCRKDQAPFWHYILNKVLR